MTVRRVERNTKRGGWTNLADNGEEKGVYRNEEEDEKEPSMRKTDDKPG